MSNFRSRTKQSGAHLTFGSKDTPLAGIKSKKVNTSGGLTQKLNIKIFANRDNKTNRVTKLNRTNLPLGTKRQKGSTNTSKAPVIAQKDISRNMTAMTKEKQSSGIEPPMRLSRVQKQISQTSISQTEEPFADDEAEVMSPYLNFSSKQRLDSANQTKKVQVN